MGNALPMQKIPPPERATPLAVATVRAELPRHPSLERVVFACFGAPMLALYEAALAAD